MSILKKTTLLIGDVAILYISLTAMILIRYFTEGVSIPFQNHLGPFTVLFILWIAIFYISDFYRPRTFRSKGFLISTIIRATIIATTISIIFFYLFGDSFFRLTPKTNLLIFSVIFIIFDFLLRQSLIKAFASGAVRTLVIGSSPFIQEIVSHVKENPHGGYRVVEWIKDSGTIDFEKLSKLLHDTHIGLIVIPPRLTKDFSMTNLIYRLLPLEINVVNALDFYEILFEKEPLEETSEEWFVVNITPHKPLYDSLKRLFDIVLSSILSIIFLPIFIIIAGLMPCTSRKGPIIYKQERIGKNGTRFMLYKFGSMTRDNEGELATTKNDARLTSFGKFLRFTHLDEIPQLWNILKGDISFTGPRPERIELVERYSSIPYYEMRHVVKPGLTGWAQINFKPSATPEEAREKLRYDIYYVKNRSLFLDLLIILKTIKYIFSSHS